jgi:cobalt-precorrin-7 (C5)-methyltransferase
MDTKDRSILIVGCGPGSADYLTPAAVKAVGDAEVLIGAQRLLDLFPGAFRECIAIGADMDDALDDIQERLVHKKIAVLVTGDPGLFSFARRVVQRFGRQCCRIIPGVSSVQMAFASISLDWADARIISAHKEDPDLDDSWPLADKIAILGGRDASIQWIAHRLLPTLEDRRVFVCENLTMNDEMVKEVPPGELSGLRVSPQTVVLIVKKSVFA